MPLVRTFVVSGVFALLTAFAGCKSDSKSGPGKDGAAADAAADHALAIDVSISGDTDVTGDGPTGDRAGDAPISTDAPPPPPLTTAPPGTTFVYVGSARGIDILYMDAEGTLTPKSWFGPDPTIGFVEAAFMAISGQYLYAVSERMPPGRTASALFAFSIDPETGGLTLLNSTSTGGPSGVHISVDGQRKKLFVANIGDDPPNMPMRAETNTVTMFEIMTDGRIGKMLGGQVKASRLPHAIYHPEPPGKLVYVPTLLAGTVDQFKVTDNGLTEGDFSFTLLRPAPDAGAQPDASAPDAPAVDDAAGERPAPVCSYGLSNGGRSPGPRHMEFSRNGQLAYLATEFGSTVNLYGIGASDGKLQGSGGTPVQMISVVPPELGDMIASRVLGTRAAEIYLHPTGKWLYVSVRIDRCVYNATTGLPAYAVGSEDSYMVRFVVAPNDGTLSSPQWVKANRQVRHFTITPDGNFVVVAGQSSPADNVMVFKIDTSAAGAGKMIEPPVHKVTTGRGWDGAANSAAKVVVAFKKP